MPQQHTQPARGMRDFLPEDVHRRQYVIDIVRRVYERYGFEPLETPAVENIETLTGKYGEEGDKLLYKVLRRGEGEASGEVDLALRYDLTVPLARVVADNRGKLPRFFKRYQIQPVWRADRPQRGRFREFYQCDVDAIGSTSAVVEAEMIAAVSEVLQAAGFTDFVVQLNHRQLLTAMLDGAGVPAERHGDALIAIDKLDKIGRDGVSKDLAARGILDTATAAALDAFESVEGYFALASASDAGRAARANVEAIVALSDSTPAKGHVRIVPRLARGLSYYTGAIFEIAVPDLAGSLGGGGRYDGLIGMFSGEQIPACGFSLGLERILVVMTERSMFPADVQASGPDVLVTIFDDGLAAESLRLATELRAANLRVELYPDALRGGKDLGKAFKYADTRKARYVTVVGQDEMTRAEVKIKNMSSGEQQTVARASAPSAIGSRTTDHGSRL
ncbi:MAG TPA: histidine--tRNA ligase [Vicinamibacterales bacterium]|jgi:histidyl-tRNA synthetase|nr:histidine--tRNA ligase [Vicinamibacterales bacterium]